MSRILVLGASGFIGSHLCDSLIQRGDEVIGIDDLSSSTGVNVSHLETSERFHFIRLNICEGVPAIGRVDAVLNFASPASPPRYSAMPVHTLLTGSMGTLEAAKFALESNARLIMASTSEVYGDPSVSPQSESYWGHVNPVGVRSCYDEAKRFSEALCMAYSREYSLDLGIARIFNTYGPRLDVNDGRVVSNFVSQALRGDDLTVYGSGEQTRSFCYVDDLVQGILALLDSDLVGPVNLGNPHEMTMLDLAQTVLELTGSKSKLTFLPLPADDPIQRLPDIHLANTSLGWSPRIHLRDGLQRTIDWFAKSVN